MRCAGRQLARARSKHLDAAVQAQQRRQMLCCIGAGNARASSASAAASLRASASITRPLLRIDAAPPSTARTMRASPRSSSTSSTPGRVQTVEREIDHFQIGLQPGVAVDLGAELQRFARALRTVGARVQHGAAIAQPRHALAVEQVRIDARHLRRGVGAQPERAAGQLIDQLEGLQVEFVAGARQQRIEVLEQRRHHQLEAVAACAVDQRASEFLDATRLARQHIGNLLGQQPRTRHGTKRSVVENGIVPTASAALSSPDRQQHQPGEQARQAR